MGWIDLIKLLSNPKNIIMIILSLLIIMISGYSIYNKFQVVRLEVKISSLESKLNNLNSELTGVKSNLTTCNTNLTSIKDYTDKVNKIVKVTDDIRNKINNLKQPVSIINTTEPIVTSSDNLIENIKPPIVTNIEGGTNVIPNKEDVEIINIANTIIKHFNTAK